MRKHLFIAVALCCFASLALRWLYSSVRSPTTNHQPIDGLYDNLSQLPKVMIPLAAVAMLLSFHRRMARERFRYRWRQTLYFGIWALLIAGWGYAVIVVVI